MRRREFITLIGSALPVSAMIAALPSTSALAAVTGAASNGAGHTVKFHDGTVVPALGQGSWHLGQADIRKLLRKKRCAQAFHSA